MPLFSFTSQAEAIKFIEEQCRANSLCLKLCGLFDKAGACFSYHIQQCLGACKGCEPPDAYNLRANKVYSKGKFNFLNFLILDRGKNEDETSVIKIENGLYRGFGYINNDYCDNIELMHDCVKSYPDNRDIHIIIQRFLKLKNGLKIIPFQTG